MSAEKGDQWRIQDFSEGGAYGQARYKKRGGVLHASAHSLLPFDVLQLKYNTKV